MKIALIVLVLLVLLLFAVLSYHGLMAKVVFSEKEMGPYWLVYEKHTGDYRRVGTVMDKIYEDLRTREGIETTRGFGLYYDNPKEVATENLRSVVGCILDLPTDETDEKTLETLRGKYKLKAYPPANSVVATHPYKGKISIILGVLKVYPKLGEYLASRKYQTGPILEIYDTPNQTMSYIAPVGMDPRVYSEFLE